MNKITEQDFLCNIFVWFNSQHENKYIWSNSDAKAGQWDTC